MLQRREKSSPRWSPAEDNRPPHYVGLTSCESPVLYPPSSIFHPQYLVLPKAIEVMDRTVTRAHRKTPSNGLSEIFFGHGNSVLNLFSFGKVRSNGGGKGTASAMSVTGVHAGRAKRTDFAPIAIIRRAASSISLVRVNFIPVSSWASGRLGVTTCASGMRWVQSA